MRIILSTHTIRRRVSGSIDIWHSHIIAPSATQLELKTEVRRNTRLTPAGVRCLRATEGCVLNCYICTHTHARTGTRGGAFCVIAVLCGACVLLRHRSGGFLATHHHRQLARTLPSVQLADGPQTAFAHTFYTFLSARAQRADKYKESFNFIDARASTPCN